MRKRTDSILFESASQATKKLVVSAVIIGVFVFYSLLHNRSTSAPALSSTSSPGSSSTPSSGSSTPSSATPDTSAGLYKNGSYTGSVADAQWGYVQVKAVVQGGKITDVQFLQYPNDRNRSIEINSYADRDYSGGLALQV
jgi:uncharacterized protein with FMN-binding domain